MKVNGDSFARIRTSAIADRRSLKSLARITLPDDGAPPDVKVARAGGEYPDVVGAITRTEGVAVNETRWHPALKSSVFPRSAR